LSAKIESKKPASERSEKMKFTPKRENDGGPVLNWLADRAMSLSAWLTRISMKYALLYEAEFEDEDRRVLSAECACGREKYGCCND
jgi:hypothetical protein